MGVLGRRAEGQVSTSSRRGKVVAADGDASWMQVLVPYVPLVLFVAVYSLTCLAGALLLLFDFRPYASLFEYFSGFRAPHDRPDLMPTQLALLLVAPVLMGVAYVMTMRLSISPITSALRRVDLSKLKTPSWLAQLVFYVAAGCGFLSLTGVGSVPDLRIWLDPQAWIDARYRVFRDLAFGEFVNVYTLIPVAAAWVILTRRATDLRSQLIRWLPLLVAIALSLLLYQKRPALNVMILVLSAAVLGLQRVDPRKARLVIASGAAGMALLYLALVMIPAYFETRVQLRESTSQPSPVAVSTIVPNNPLLPRLAVPSLGPARTAAPVPMVTPNAEYPVIPTLGTLAGPSATPAVIAEGGKGQTVLLYALLGPLNRTSVSALYYPVVFPDLHPYYGLDLGQDMLSKLPWFHLPPMPDDNVVIWDQMAPSMPGGRAAAPFQFVLYSQVGLVGALLSSVVVGALLALAWRCVQDRALPMVWSSLAGSLVVLLSVFLAMDSARNSLLVSYGVVWGLLFVAGAMGLVSLTNRLSLRRMGLSRRLASGDIQ